MHAGGPYTFGDGELAAERLKLLADAYEAATRALVDWAALGPVATLVDLGCGPGHSTRLLGELLSPQQLIGLDNSPLHLCRARQSALSTVRFLEHDVARKPLPVPARSVLFCRFLLAHLGEPGRALATWARSVGPAGVLLIQETADLRTDVPAFRRYYAWVGEMHAHYGQSLYIGRELTVLAEASGWRVRAARETVNLIPVPVMARLHAMNLATWRHDPFVAARHPQEELDRLADELARLCAPETSGSVESVLGEVVLEA